MTNGLWEILVPTIHSSNGKPIRTRFHKVWDKKVREISGGLTIMQPARGQWVAPDGKLFMERMIPVRVLASCHQISEIVKFTIDYYNQIAVLAYKISDEVILKYR